jgi:hypothetical protein
MFNNVFKNDFMDLTIKMTNPSIKTTTLFAQKLSIIMLVKKPR